MRTTFVHTLFQLAKKDRRIMLVSGDLGYSVFEEFMEELPEQYINVGIIEQTMMGFAAGLAMEGKIPFVYSILPFSTMRPFEQIRNDICYQHLNVKIVGVGAGFSYGPYGHTHHGLEDIGIMRTLADLTIFAPGDPTETEFVTEQAAHLHGSVYLRLGKAGEPVLYRSTPTLSVGKGSILMHGNDICIVATSTMVERAVQVAEQLKKTGINAGVISMHTIKPFDDSLIIQQAKQVRVLCTLEEHSVIGGLGSVVAEVLAEHRLAIPFHRFGSPDHFLHVIGRQEFMRTNAGLSMEHIVKELQTMYASTGLK